MVGDAIWELDGSERKQLLKRLERYTQNGFWNYIGEYDCPIKSEGTISPGVYRLGYKLIRIIGFFETDDHSSFIAIDAFLKHGQGLSEPEKARIRKVGEVKKNGDWGYG